MGYPFCAARRFFVSKFNRSAWLTAVPTTALVAVVLLAPTPTPTNATPKFARNEGVSCAYCHVSPRGGGKRNYRGSYYQKNKLSFAGFDDKDEAKKSGEEVGPDADKTPKSLTPPVMSVADAKAKLAPAEAAYNKAKKDPVAKKAYVDALADLGHSTMLDQSLTAPKRFTDALKIVNQTLKLDSSNKQAQEDKAACESALKTEKERGGTTPAVPASK